MACNFPLLYLFYIEFAYTFWRLLFFFAFSCSHAEPLARRSLLSYLYSEVEKFLRGRHDDCILEAAESGLLRLRPGITLHMYTSSQPCGNASLKRWAKSKTTVYPAASCSLTCPAQPHPRLHMPAQAVQEGQVALLLKLDTTGMYSRHGAVLTIIRPADWHNNKLGCDKENG